MRWLIVRRTFTLIVTSGLLFVSSMASSASEACDEITPSNKAYCSLIKFCQTLTDAEAKEECNRLAEEMSPNQADGDTDTESKILPEESKPDTPVEPEPTPISAKPVEEVQTKETPVPATEETILSAPDREVRVITEEIQLPTQDSPQETETVLQPDEDAVVTEGDETDSDGLSVSNAYDRLENKRRFAAAIIYYREVGFKSAILVLSNGLVFRSDYSALFKPEIGEVVNVRKRSVLSKVTYNLVGGKGGAIQVFRQRCEYKDMRQDTRRLCNLGQRVLDERSED